jgi:ribosomal protein S18 acetylase RimI-like enzyme
MTNRASDVLIDDLTLTVYRRGTALEELGSIGPLYAGAYAEAPYYESPADVAEFGNGWPSRVEQPSFRLVVARLDGEPVGFSFGHQLTPTTRWWTGMLDEVDQDVITERPGRTFAVIELAVERAVRGHGIARELHTHLLAGLTEERATLLVRPDAIAARSAYLSWSYRPIGRLQPFPDGPTYDAMIKTPLDVDRFRDARFERGSTATAERPHGAGEGTTKVPRC